MATTKEAQDLFTLVDEKYYGDFIEGITNKVGYEYKEVFIKFIESQDLRKYAVDFSVKTDGDGNKSIVHDSLSDMIELFNGTIFDVSLLHDDWSEYTKTISVFENYTPHDIMLNSGIVFKTKGEAKVLSHQKHVAGLISEVVFDGFEGFDGKPREGVIYIVSPEVLNEGKKLGLTCFVTPSFEKCCKDKNGNIVSISGFIK